MIELREVSKTYPVDHVALCSTSLGARSGELVWISGPSGSGKSTLLGIAGLLISPSSGEVWIDDQRMDLATDAARTSARAALIGFIPQSPRLFTELTATQNVSLALPRPDGVLAVGALGRVGMDAYGDSAVSTLSGGQQQRVSTARALVSDPPLVLADEPSSGLDDANAATTFAVLRALADDGRCVIVASHDSRIAGFADRSFLLSGVSS